jgi:hypothetical protein
MKVVCGALGAATVAYWFRLLATYVFVAHSSFFKRSPPPLIVAQELVSVCRIAPMILTTQS